MCYFLAASNNNGNKITAIYTSIWKTKTITMENSDQTRFMIENHCKVSHSIQQIATTRKIIKILKV